MSSEPPPSPSWHWMKVAENTSPTGADRLVYEHTPEDKWKETRPFGIDRREDPETEHPNGMNVRLGRDTDDLATHEGGWGGNCVEKWRGGSAILL